ncbi:hypothetical protein Hte_010158 [Hypoxylon texense]
MADNDASGAISGSGSGGDAASTSTPKGEGNGAVSAIRGSDFLSPPESSPSGSTPDKGKGVDRPDEQGGDPGLDSSPPGGSGGDSGQGSGEFWREDSEGPEGSEGGPGSGLGFFMPEPDFDPTLDDFITQRREEMELRGELESGHMGLENSAEAELEATINDLEKHYGHPVSSDERERIALKIRRLRSGGWLEAAKVQLVGQTTVPIEMFNRLVAEHEATIGYVANRLSAFQREKVAAVRKAFDEGKEDGAKEAAKKPEADKKADAEKKAESSKKGAGKTEAGTAAAGPAEAGPAEAGPAVAGPAVAGPAVAGPAVAGPAAAGPAEAGPAEAGTAEDVARRDEAFAAERAAFEATQREFWEVIERTRTDSADIRTRVDTLHKALGFRGEVDANQAIHQIMERIRESPTDDIVLRLAAIRQSIEMNTLRAEIETERVRNTNLQRQADNRRSDREIQHEARIEYGLFNEEEIERRTDEVTQMYRLQRRELIDNVLRASAIILRVSQQVTPGLRDDLVRARQDYLNLLNLPQPRRPGPRQPRQPGARPGGARPAAPSQAGPSGTGTGTAGPSGAAPGTGAAPANGVAGPSVASGVPGTGASTANVVPGPSTSAPSNAGAPSGSGQ